MPLTPPSCYSFPRHTSFSAQHLSRCILFYLKYYIFPVFVCLFGCPPPLYMRLHAHGLRPSHHIYAACMLTAPPILCLYAPACSRHLPHLRNSMPPACSWQHLSVVLSSVSPTPSYMRLHAHGPRPPPPPPLYRLHNHGNARPLPLQHRLRMHSTRTHYPNHTTTLYKLMTITTFDGSTNSSTKLSNYVPP